MNKVAMKNLDEIVSIKGTDPKLHNINYIHKIYTFPFKLWSFVTSTLAENVWSKQKQ